MSSWQIRLIRGERWRATRKNLDYAVDRRAEAEIHGLASKLNMVNEKMCDVDDRLREHLPLHGGPVSLSGSTSS
jgi:hypothetical protein